HSHGTSRAARSGSPPPSRRSQQAPAQGGGTYQRHPSRLGFQGVRPALDHLNSLVAKPLDVLAGVTGQPLQVHAPREHSVDRSPHDVHHTTPRPVPRPPLASDLKHHPNSERPVGCNGKDTSSDYEVMLASGNADKEQRGGYDEDRPPGPQRHRLLHRAERAANRAPVPRDVVNPPNKRLKGEQVHHRET